MTFYRLGRDPKGNRLFDSIDEDALQSLLVDALPRTVGMGLVPTRTTARGAAFRGEVARRVVDAGDPREAGWAYLYNASDPRAAEYADLLAPLGDRRRMMAPLVFHGEDFDDWLTECFFARELEGRSAPQYVLIVGSPEQVPFRFQTLLSTVAKVGRVDLPAKDLETYVQKLLRLETAEKPAVERAAILFAPDAGPDDPTHYSRRYMVEPLERHMFRDRKVQTTMLSAAEASKERLSAALQTVRPLLVYTASHGLGALSESQETQERFNGAICCQDAGGGSDALFSADDVPMNEPFAEGAVFFQFACFGYGTPAHSDYAHWLGESQTEYTKRDFVAALPKKLLAHPRGPIAYVGHLDTAFLHGFTDEKYPDILDRWHARMAPFVHAIDAWLRDAQPSGVAMRSMNDRYNSYNAILTNTYDQSQRGKMKWTPSSRQRLIDAWIIRGDAQNYMIFGDPGAALRVPEAQ